MNEKNSLSEAFESRVLDSISEHVIYYNKDFEIKWANRAAADSVNLSPLELIGKKCYSIWQNRISPCENCPVLDALKTGKSNSVEMITPDGRVWLIKGNPVYNKNEKIIGAVEITREITDLKEVEQKLIASQENYRNLIERSKDAIFLVNLKNEILFANQACYDIFGYTPEEFLTIQGLVRRILHPKYEQQFEDFWKNYEITKFFPENTTEWAWIKKDGELVYTENIFFNILDEKKLVIGFGTVARNITLRKKVEKKLRESEEKYRNLINNILDQIIETDLDGTITFISPQVYDLFGYKPEEVIGRRSIQFVHPDDINIIKEAMEKSIKSGEMISSEYRLKHKNGYYVNVASRGRLIKRGDDHKLIAVIRDITAQKRAEKKIRDSELQYRTTLNSIGDPLHVVDKNLRIILINPAMKKWLDDLNLIRDVKNQKLDEIFTFLPKNVFKEYEEVFTTGQPILTEDETKIEEKIYYTETRKIPIFREGEVHQIITFIRDITDRKEADLLLKESEEKYRNILENMMEGYYETDLIGNLVYVNIEYCKIMGYSKEEIIGKNYRLLYDTNSSEILFNMFNQVYKTGIPRPPTGVVKVITKKKKLIYFEGSVDLLYDSKGNKVGFYGLVRDITKRKIAEQKLKKSEEKYRSLFENMNAGFALHEVMVDDNNKPVDYRYIEVNPAFEKLTGMKKEDLIGKTVTEAIPGTENDPADWIGKFGGVGLTGIPITVEDYSEAFDRWYKVSGYSPKKGYFAVTFTDITERKKAEEALKESEEKFRTIAEQSFMSIIILQDGILKYFNERFPKGNRYSPEEIKNWKPYEFAKLIHPDDRDFVMDQARKKAIGEKGVIEQYKYRIIRKDGEIRWLENFSKTINYKGRPADFIMSIDITEQINAEKQLKKSEKKYREAFNRSNFYKDLIAHDINNILQNILSSVELSFLYLEEEKDLNELKQMLKISKQQVSRAANLISNTRKLSRLEDIKIFTQPIEAIEVLNKSIEFLLKSYQDKKIKLDVENPYKTIMVQGNELLIDVFENILINAVKHNQNSPIDIMIKVSSIQKEGLDFFKFEFKDNAIGIPEVNKELIFQRVINTEKTVSGMGIGLSLVKKILDIYEGQIWVEDKVQGDYSRGSNFIVLIPEVKTN